MIAVTTGAERRIFKILSHALPVASRLFASRTLVLQPLMTYIICRWWGEDVFMSPAAMKAPVWGTSSEQLFCPRVFD